MPLQDKNKLCENSAWKKSLNKQTPHPDTFSDDRPIVYANLSCGHLPWNIFAPFHLYTNARAPNSSLLSDFATYSRNILSTYSPMIMGRTRRTQSSQSAGPKREKQATAQKAGDANRKWTTAIKWLRRWQKSGKFLKIRAVLSSSSTQRPWKLVDLLAETS